MAPVTIRAARTYYPSTFPGSVAAVCATATAAATVPVVEGVDGTATIPGWLKTSSNVGLASQGLVAGDLSVYTGLSAFGGNPYPSAANITGTHNNRRFNLSTILAPGDNTVFNRCHFEVGNAGNMVIIAGTGVEFNDCDFVFTGTGTVERCHIVANPYYCGEGSFTTIKNCRMTGGTIFINITSAGALIEDVYGYGQDPDNNGGAQHRDGFTTRDDGGTITLTRCRFDCDQGATTGAFFTQDTYTEPAASRTLTSPIILNQCSFEGSGYCMTLEDAKDLRVTDCRIRQHGSYQVGTHTQNGRVITTTWTNNYVWANDPPLYRGSAISDPA